MDRIARFEKVSFEQFKKDCSHMNMSEEDIKRCYDSIKLPSRATTGSAGYDFYLPMDIDCVHNNWQKIPTGIRCHIKDGWVLMICPKSGQGYKYRAKLANTIGIIDSDYYNSDNEGHISSMLSSEKPMHLRAGDKYQQGIFLPFGITENDDADGVRNGGFGSTGR